VALSEDGLTLAAGGTFDDSNVGATWVFTARSSGGRWNQQRTKLVGTGASVFRDRDALRSLQMMEH
jgi:hypothetical protein